MKVALFANSNLWLKPFYDVFHLNNHEVWWATYEPHVYDELLRLKYPHIVYYADPPVFDSTIGKYTYSFPGLAEEYFLREINPDVVITDVSNRLSETFASKSCLWIQAYHSFATSVITFTTRFLALILALPGTYHYDAYLRRMKSLFEGN